MKSIMEFFTRLPLWLVLAVALVLAGALLLLLFVRLSQLSLRRLVRQLSQTEDTASLIKKKLPLRRAQANVRLLVQLARKHELNLPVLTGLDSLWLQKFQAHPKEGLCRLLLEFSPAASIFICFKAALQNRSLQAAIREWLASRHDFLPYQQIALAGKGEPFDGKAAAAFLADAIDQIREMTGDPEWASRFFAVKILIHDSEPRSVRSVWESLDDSHALIRKTVVQEAPVQDREIFYSRIKALYLDDPVFEVRQAARLRLEKDFNDLFVVDYTELSTVQAGHILELLDPARDDDVNLAISYLAGADMELRFSAALFLERSGTLYKLFLRASPDDSEDLEHIRRLLTNASSVRINSFLEQLPEDAAYGTLLLGAELLAETGDRAHILPLWTRISTLVRSRPLSQANLLLYSAGLKAVQLRGTDQALLSLGEELRRLRADAAALLAAASATAAAAAAGTSGNATVSDATEAEPQSEAARFQLLDLVLESLLVHGDFIFCPMLFEFLVDPAFPLRDRLRTVLAKMPPSFVLPFVLKIVRQGREAYPHAVRMDAFRLIGSMKLDYSIQFLLEHLPTLPLDELKNFMKLLAETDIEVLEQRAAALLQSDDASVRAALIAGLPATGRKTFLKEIRESLEDADPEVRVAAVWALVEYDEAKTISRAAEMLRDPVERVRCEVGRALGAYGSEAALLKLAEVLADKNEVDSVKAAALEGLALSDEEKSLQILTDSLAEDYFEAAELQQCIARKKQRKFIRQLIDIFKDAKGVFKDKLSMAFKLMGGSGEQAMVELLEEGIPSLKPYIVEILESTGYVESWIRKLAVRDPKVRRAAAVMLSTIGSASAFRGIVLAARDPDQEVRVQVTKALERLNTEDGQTILEQLQADPDKRVRTYTEWAMARIKAKNL